MAHLHPTTLHQQPVPNSDDSLSGRLFHSPAIALVIPDLRTGPTHRTYAQDLRTGPTHRTYAHQLTRNPVLEGTWLGTTVEDCTCSGRPMARQPFENPCAYAIALHDRKPRLVPCARRSRLFLAARAAIDAAQYERTNSRKETEGITGPGKSGLRPGHGCGRPSGPEQRLDPGTMAKRRADMQVRYAQHMQSEGARMSATGCAA
jgi:hypothetical protein